MTPAPTSVTDKPATADAEHHLSIEVVWRDRMARHVATRCRVSLEIAAAITDIAISVRP
jgi:hypothetical protein